jgi:uncharacterized membrane protein
MTDLIVDLLLWVCALGCALVAGLYFAFSTFIMTALGRIPAPAGIAAMQAINTVIQRSLFMPLFFGTTLAALAVAALALWRWVEAGSVAMLAGGLVYVLGMFVCTVVFNVPLNNRLDAADPQSAAAGEVWARYLRVWTRWNHVRTLASTLAAGLFVLALVW